MKPRPMLQSLLAVAATILAGMLVRFAQLGLPPFVTKYAGSALWAATIYWVASSLLGQMRLVGVATIAGCVATAVEFFKLYRSPGMDAFRGTLPGVLLLGRYFSTWNILAYWVGIAAAVAMDGSIRSRRVK
jgi:hypothetical protein